MMKAVVGHLEPHPRQRITNMEKLAPGFAEAVGQWEQEERLADRVTLVLAADQRRFLDWHRQAQRAAGGPLPRVRRVTGSRDLQGCQPDNVEIVELPDWHLSMSYDEHQRVEQMLDAIPSRGRSVLLVAAAAQSPSLPKVAKSRLIALEASAPARGGQVVMRVRMGRTKERKGAIDGDPLDVVTTQYLDGKALRVASTRKYFQEDEVAFDAVPARTKDITDFGRLTTAAKALAVSMVPYGPDNEPSPEQLAVFINGYRNLLEWRRKVREQMTRAEGEIDAVETLLTQII